MTFTLSPITTHWHFLAGALTVTLALTAAVLVISFVIGLAVGLVRSYGPLPVERILGFYVDTMRSVPVLVILVWFFFALPIAFGLSITPMAAAIVGLSIHSGAYMSEAVRAGLLSIRSGQRRAGFALGMSFAETLRVVILPQALIRMLPAFGSLATLTIKDTAIAAVIAVPELMRQTQIVAGQTYRPFELYTFTMAVYFLLCFPIARIIDHVYGRLAHRGAS